MLDNIHIREISERTDPALESVEDLFFEMYDYMKQHGLMIDLAIDGKQRWIEAVKKTLGRFGTLSVCTKGDEVIGFAHGSIRLTPDYLGNKKVGVITHVHVQHQYRGMGSGLLLVKSLEQWFSKQDVHSVELQVLSENLPAIGFWEKLGYYNELLQCRKMKENL
jgi:ribosomal protein S18 acetylase RimI-like enzyme